MMVSATAFAQTPKAIKLTKGQKMSAKSSMNMDMDLGMGTMKNETSSDFSIQVIDENPKNYTITYTVNKMKIAVDGMGQSMSFDSDKPEDRNTEIGQTASAKINMPDTFLLNKTTGELVPLNDDVKNEKPSGGGMFAMSNNQNQAAMDAFLIIPANIKVGDSWSDSVMVKGLTTKKTFKWVSTDKDIASIKITGTMTGSVEQEAQGMTINVSMDMTFNETKTVNTKTGQVIKTTNDADLKNTLESMGMTMNSKIITTTEYSN